MVTAFNNIAERVAHNGTIYLISTFNRSIQNLKSDFCIDPEFRDFIILH
jgi:hypothetical protein